LEVKVTQKVTIPGFGKAESLNVAIATAILTDNFKRLIP
jgi:RNA methyltransferase, TrmH family